MGYRCIYYKKIGNKLFKNNNQVCWAGVNSTYYWKTPNDKVKEKLGNIPRHIYISIKLIKKDHIQYIENTLKVINNITPCSLVSIDNVQYIKYRLTFNKSYNANLLLLNFIRNLWHTPNLDVGKYHEDISKYNNEEPFLFLTTCLRDNVILNGKYYYGDHCNIVKNIIPKTVKDIKNNMKYLDIYGTSNFLKKEYNGKDRS